jgi:hypothetical protein
MFEGKELEGKIGDVGAYSVDLTSKGEVEIMVGVKIDLVAEAKKLAAKTSTPLDDKAIAWLEILMGRAGEQKAAS